MINHKKKKFQDGPKDRDPFGGGSEDCADLRAAVVASRASRDDGLECCGSSAASSAGASSADLHDLLDQWTAKIQVGPLHTVCTV